MSATPSFPTPTVYADLVTPNGAAHRAQDILQQMCCLAEELQVMGDNRGVEVTQLLIDQWAFRVQAINRGICQRCLGFTIASTAEAHCDCPAPKKVRNR